MSALDWFLLTVGVLVPVLCGVVTEHLGMGPLPGVVVGGAILVGFTQVFRVR